MTLLAQAAVNIEANVTTWVVFNLAILFMLGLDLGVFHRSSHVVRVREALTWTAVWIALALAFNVGLYYYLAHDEGARLAAGGLDAAAADKEGAKFARDKAVEFFTGYVVEKALSVDNLFVFLVIFNYFQVPARYQHKVLFWGVLGALALRLVFILAGVWLLSKFHWLLYVFGAFLVYTGIKMAVADDEGADPENNIVIRFFRRWMPVASKYDGDKFFVIENGRRLATPLFLVLWVVNVTDVIFAVDSIPAILAITKDPFIVYSSNAFAILGLRALYFALAAMMGVFHYLKYGLSLVLVFIGIKMLAEDIYKMPPLLSLGIVLGTLLLSVLASLFFGPRESGAISEPPDEPDNSGAYAEAREALAAPPEQE